MKLNLKKPLIVFDLETTGLDLVNDRIIQISYIKVFPDGKEVRVNKLINPTIPIPKEVTLLTGISDADVSEAPAFADISEELKKEFTGCDFAGYNSNHFDVPMLAEEFYRAGIDFDFRKCRLIDAQSIFHRMEKRNLAAAYEFYCGRKMEDDFEAHRADQDTEATYRVLQGELDRYNPETQPDEERHLENDMDKLAEFSKMNDNVDFAGRIVMKPMVDKNNVPIKNSKGEPYMQEVINFGKYKGKAVADVLRRDLGYYDWIQRSDFTNDTKQAFTRIRMRELSKQMNS
jgi:DNA polymerase-3 subunit epsilon